MSWYVDGRIYEETHTDITGNIYILRRILHTFIHNVHVYVRISNMYITLVVFVWNPIPWNPTCYNMYNRLALCSLFFVFWSGGCKQAWLCKLIVSHLVSNGVYRGDFPRCIFKTWKIKQNTHSQNQQMFYRKSLNEMKKNKQIRLFFSNYKTW